MIRKISTDKYIVADRIGEEPDPDFETDAEVLFLGTLTPVRVEVGVHLLETQTRELEPTFVFRLLPPKDTRKTTIAGSYGISLYALMKGVKPMSLDGPNEHELELSDTVRREILVWWDQHGELAAGRRTAWIVGFSYGREFDLGDDAYEGKTAEDAAEQWAKRNSTQVREYQYEGRSLARKTGLPEKPLEDAAIEGWIAGLADNIQVMRETAPTRGEVSRRLRTAGLRDVFCGLNADWSVPAWFLSPGTANRTDHGFYLLDTEDQNDQGAIFVLVRRHFNEADNDEVEELSSGTLIDVIAGAASIMERYT